MKNSIELNGENFIYYVDKLVPEFQVIRRKDRDDSIEQYGIFWEFSAELRRLIDNNNEELLKKYVQYIELMLDSNDEYVKQVLYDTVIEFFALSGKKYYDAAKIYLSGYGFKNVESCRKYPPQGKSPKY